MFRRSRSIECKCKIINMLTTYHGWLELAGLAPAWLATHVGKTASNYWVLRDRYFFGIFPADGASPSSIL